MNILTYEKSTENNYKTFNKLYNVYKKWVKRYENKFALAKYELIHLT